MLGDLYRTLDDETADMLGKAVNLMRRGKTATLVGLKNPWVKVSRKRLRRSRARLGDH